MNRTIWIIVVIAVVVGGYFLFNRGYSAPQSASQPTPTTTTESSSPSAATSATAVSIKNFAFNPATVTVKKGTTVTWTNEDSASHTVTSDSGSVLQRESLSSGKSFSFTFNIVGNFPYHCSIHPNMQGTITVTE